MPKKAEKPSSPARGRRITKAERALFGLILFVAWAFPAAWVVLSPPIGEPHKPTAETKRRIQQVNKAIHEFVSAHGKPPQDLGVLRAYAKSEKIPFQAYDAFGQRLEYQRLDEDHYLLRSFGADGAQNSERTPPDTGVIRWGRRAKSDVGYAPPNAATAPLAALTGFYPAALAAGAASPDDQWLARIYADQASARRTLIVRHKQKEGLFMAARHDRVEEFLWMPLGDAIIFSATGSTRHRDGLYLWDLTSDSQVNLFDAASKSMPMSPSRGGGKLWIALASVAAGPTPYVFAYVASRHDGALDPQAFFNVQNLMALKLDGKGQPTFLDPEEVKLGEFESPIKRTYRPAFSVSGTGGLPTQRRFLALAASGNLEPVLLKWHEYSEKEQRSPLYPYCLWVLSTLYGESFAALAGSGGTDADVLRTFGTEIARALIEHETAPSYLKSLALFTYEALMEGETLPYHISDLKLPGGKTPSDDGAKASPKKHQGSSTATTEIPP